MGIYDQAGPGTLWPRGKTRTVNTGPVRRESRWEVVEPVVWRYVEVMEFFPPKGYSHSSIGDPGLIPGLGRSAEEAIGYPLQYSWASLVAQLVKTPPSMQETWVRSPGWEDPLEKGKVIHSSLLAWRIPWTV